jgi:hypothetical protein
MDRHQRYFRRDLRNRFKDLAWVFIASPVLVAAFGQGRYSVWEAAFLPMVGLLVLLWFRRHSTVPEHVAAVERVRLDGKQDPHAMSDCFYLAWCDCGWSGDDKGMSTPPVLKHGSTHRTCGPVCTLGLSSVRALLFQGTNSSRGARGALPDQGPLQR